MLRPPLPQHTHPGSSSGEGVQDVVRVWSSEHGPSLLSRPHPSGLLPRLFLRLFSLPQHSSMLSSGHTPVPTGPTRNLGIYLPLRLCLMTLMPHCPAVVNRVPLRLLEGRGGGEER